MKKRFLALSVLLVITLLAGATSYAVSVVREVNATLVSEVEMKVDGKATYFNGDGGALLYNDRLYIPIRSYVEQTGGNVSWDDELQIPVINTYGFVQWNAINDALTDDLNSFEGEGKYQLIADVDNFRMINADFKEVAKLGMNVLEIKKELIMKQVVTFEHPKLHGKTPGDYSKRFYNAFGAGLRKSFQNNRWRWINSLPVQNASTYERSVLVKDSIAMVIDIKDNAVAVEIMMLDDFINRECENVSGGKGVFPKQR